MEALLKFTMAVLVIACPRSTFGKTTIVFERVILQEKPAIHSYVKNAGSYYKCALACKETPNGVCTGFQVLDDKCLLFTGPIIEQYTDEWTPIYYDQIGYKLKVFYPLKEPTSKLYSTPGNKEESCGPAIETRKASTQSLTTNPGTKPKSFFGPVTETTKESKQSLDTNVGTKSQDKEKKECRYYPGFETVIIPNPRIKSYAFETVCLSFHSRMLSFADAFSNCLAQDAVIAITRYNHGLQIFMDAFERKYGYYSELWMGIRYHKATQTWQWRNQPDNDGHISAVESINSPELWAPGEPRIDSGNLCAVISHEGLVSKNCEEHFGFVCFKPEVF